VIIASLALIAITGTGTVFGLQTFLPKKVAIVAPVVDSPAATTAVSCGTVTVTNSNFLTISYGDCFDANFAACTPATMTIENESSFGKGTVVAYQIQSKQADSCLMQWQYVTLPPNATWEGKTVTCSYDNTQKSKATLDAQTDFTGCTGPLVELMAEQSASSIQGGTTTKEPDGTTFTAAPGTAVIKNE